MTIKVESASAPQPELTAQSPVVDVVENQADTPAASSEAESSDESGKSKEEQEEKESTEAAEDKEVEEEEGEETEEQSKVAKKPNKGVQKRFGELTKARAKAEQERDYWREMATKATKPELDQAKSESNGTEQINGEPKEDDFESHAAYVKALAKHEAKAEFEALKKAEAEKAKEESVRSERSKQVESWNKAADALREKHDDYDELMAETPMPPPAIAAALYKSGPELAYALAKNRDVLDRIYALDPIEAVYELGQFKASLQPSAKTEPKTITKAPAPINPIAGKGSGGTVRSIFDPNISQAEYERLRAKSAN